MNVADIKVWPQPQKAERFAITMEQREGFMLRLLRKLGFSIPFPPPAITRIIEYDGTQFVEKP